MSRTFRKQWTWDDDGTYMRVVPDSRTCGTPQCVWCGKSERGL